MEFQEINFNGCEDFIDFDGIDDNAFIPKIEEEKKNDIEYDKETTVKYKILRKIKLDPISMIEQDPEYSFCFKYKWDPYTGERLGEDSDGGLYFDPDVLIKYFYTRRLNKLWVAPVDETQGYYEGYFDDGVGAGEQFYLEGRGYHPEWYLFRLPIIDCYLTKDHNRQIITLGPKLTDEELEEIDTKANMRPGNYKKLFGRSRPSLVQMKKWYDNAISRTPTGADGNPVDQKHYTRINQENVNCLINLKG